MTSLQEACPLTGQSANVQGGTFDGWQVSGPYTDGDYRIARSVIAQTRALSLPDRAKLVTWVIDQHRQGDNNPLIGSWTIDETRGRRPLTYDLKVQRFFQMLRFRNFRIGTTLRFSGLIDDEYYRWVGPATAWMEAYNQGELNQILSAMCDEQLLKESGGWYVLTSNGLRRLDGLYGSGVDSTQAFVAMWFNDQMDQAYAEGFAAAISDAGYDPLRIDKKEHSNKIDDEIIAEIRRSRFIVADFTCGAIKKDGLTVGIVRGGVYYEAGFAQGIGLPVIWTVRADCIGHVHFDTRQYSHIVWKDASDLRSKLSARIGAVIGSPRLV
jgi:hypothetical protein